jgi:aryl-alcohol dehydrogenase-like predicted oxidoreductase
VIATKFGHFTDGDPSRGGAGARWIAQAVEDSLRRLGTDRIDLYQQHFPDPLVEPHETLTALDRLVREGKIVHHGVCNLGPDEVQSRCEIARSEGLSAPVSAQNRYNLLRQETRSELVPTLKANDMALIPYFPLASGMLTGKYRRGEPLPVDSRFAHHLDAAQADRIIERDGPAIQRLQLWAAEQGRSVADLAIAWLAAQPIVASVIAGVTKPGQVAANARATDWTLSPEQIEHVALLVGGAAQR